MTVAKQRRYLLQTIAVVVLMNVLAVLFLLPKLLKTDDVLPAVGLSELETTAGTDFLTVRGTFGQTIEKAQILWLYAENAELQVKVGGQNYSFVRDRDAPGIFRSPGSTWFSIVLPEIKKGEIVEITVCSYYGKNEAAAERLLQNIHIGDGRGLYQLLFEKIGFFGIIFIVTVFFGIVFMTEGAIDLLLGMTMEGTRIVLFGFYCFAGGLWCVTDRIYPYLSLMISPDWAAALIDAGGLLLFPVALTMLIRYYIRGQYTRFFINVTLGAEIATAALCLTQQATGFSDLLESQMNVNIVAIPCIGIAMVCILIELRQYRDSHLLLLFLTVLPVFAGGLLDAVNVFVSFADQRTLMQYGFIPSSFMMMAQIAVYAKAELSKEETMRRLENELTESHISIMLSQVQPHFLYNTLTAISVLCDKDARLAKKATVEFSEYLRGNLDSLSYTGPVPFENELHHIEIYLRLEKMRFDEELNVIFQIDATSFMIPALTVQPLVENAVKYGVGKKEGGGTVTISSNEYEDRYEIVVADDGVGFDPYETQYDGRTHIGIDNVKNRLHRMVNAVLSIESFKGVGTTAVISIPKEAEKE